MKNKQKEMLSRRHHSVSLVHQLSIPGSRAASRFGRGERTVTATRPQMHHIAPGMVGPVHAVLVKRACGAVAASGELCSSEVVRFVAQKARTR